MLFIKHNYFTGKKKILLINYEFLHTNNNNFHFNYYYLYIFVVKVVCNYK